MSEMTESIAPSAKPAMPSFWEDVIEIFIHPVDVLRRRKDASPWPPMLFVALMLGLLTFATFNTLQPVLEAEMTRQAAAQMKSAGAAAANPEAMAKGREIGMNIARYAAGLAILIAMLFVGLGTWIASKVVGSKTTFVQAMAITGWAYFPRILGAIASGVQGLFLDVSGYKTVVALSLSPARFMDVDTANPMLYQLLGRLDVTIIWETVLLAIGIAVIGKVPKGKAIAFGVTIFVVGSLYAIRQAIVLS
jgi:hypothetical protein